MNNPLEFQQSPSNPLELAAQFENRFAGPDSENNTYNKDIYLRSYLSPSKSRDTQNGEPTGLPGTCCLCEPEIAEIPGDTIAKSRKRPSFHNPSGDCPPFYPLENGDPAEGLLQCCRKPGPVANLQGTAPGINCVRGRRTIKSAGVPPSGNPCR